MKSVGLALSGGGARAVAHIGVIKALEEEGIKFSKIAGTSLGAVIGALYASGLSVDEIYERIVNFRFWSFVNPAIPGDGFLSMASAKKLLEEHLPVKSFEELKVGLCITATDLEKGESVCFSEGDLLQPLLASCCMPVIYKPVKYKGKNYIDGGILNNLPVNIIREEMDFIIGVHSNPVADDFKPTGVKSMVERTLMMAITQNVYACRHLCDVFIEPKPLQTYKVLDFGKSKEIFEIGYRYTKENIDSFGLDKLK